MRVCISAEGGADTVALGVRVEFGGSASTPSGHVWQASGPSVERELVSIKNNEASVKVLLASFPSQAIPESPAVLTNRKPRSLLKVWPEAEEDQVHRKVLGVSGPRGGDPAPALKATPSVYSRSLPRPMEPCFSTRPAL